MRDDDGCIGKFQYPGSGDSCAYAKICAIINGCRFRGSAPRIPGDIAGCLDGPRRIAAALMDDVADAQVREPGPAMHLKTCEHETSVGVTAALAVKPFVFGLEGRNEPLNGGGVKCAAFGWNRDFVYLQRIAQLRKSLQFDGTSRNPLLDQLFDHAGFQYRPPAVHFCRIEGAVQADRALLGDECL